MADTDNESELVRLRAENKRLRALAVECPDCRRILNHLHESHESVEEERRLRRLEAEKKPSLRYRVVNAVIATLMALIVLMLLGVILYRYLS